MKNMNQAGLYVPYNALHPKCQLPFGSDIMLIEMKDLYTFFRNKFFVGFCQTDIIYFQTQSLQTDTVFVNDGVTFEAVNINKQYTVGHCIY